MDDIKKMISSNSTRLIDRLRLLMRQRNYAYATEKIYISWILRFIRFHNKRHPSEIGKIEIESFISHLATQLNHSKATQRSALNAIIFLYREFLNREVGQLKFNLSQKNKRIPTVFSHAEAIKVINCMKNHSKLMAVLTYGSGLRISEICTHVVQQGVSSLISPADMSCVK